MCKKWCRGAMALLILLTLLGMLNGVNAQKYNNEWIVNGKSYFKFKIATDGLYRITGSSLTEAGLSGATGSNLQLWRNGVQVPIYVSVTGALGTGDYIEFWGEHNDGGVDTALYKKPEDQLNKAKSFEGDSASYFLTINTNSSQNLRIKKGVNTAATDAASMTPLPYFYYTVQKGLGTTFNAGAASVYGTSYVYMSDYKGKCFGIVLNGSKSTTTTFSDLYGYTADAAIKGEIKVGIAGASNQGNNRFITIQGTDGANTVAPLGDFESKVIKIKKAEIGSSYKVTITNGSGNTTDKVNASFVELHYPRIFNFGGAGSFSFDLGASTSPRLLNIANFAANGSTPILYNLTTGIRYQAEQNGSNYQFVLPAMDSSHFALVGQASNSYTSIGSTAITKRSFPDLTSSDQQGDYLIISNKALYGDGDYVTQYASYRKSPEGGNYNVHIYNIDDLEDMFAFGVHSSPLSIINFLKFARHDFTTAPKFVFLIGRGLTFNNLQGANESDPLYQAQNLIPTFGWPASDVMLTSENKEPIAATAIGRLSAVKPVEIKNYLDKVKVYEAAQKSDDHTIENNSWKKNVVFISGGINSSEENLFGSYLGNYQTILKDSLYGANEFRLRKVTADQVFDESEISLKNLFASGLGLISYFGHGASTTIAYGELNDPSVFNNNNKYPLLFTSGCDVGDCFSYMAGRMTTINNITERYLFTKDKGSVGFVAETYLGVTSYLDSYNKILYKNISLNNYGIPIAISMKNSQNGMINLANLKQMDSISSYAHAEQTNFFGDPSISLYNFP
ncbi:putative type IX secretion system sortase PorU2, partial [Arachidicoccus ginsenosidivorans]